MPFLVLFDNPCNKEESEIPTARDLQRSQLEIECEIDSCEFASAPSFTVIDIHYWKFETRRYLLGALSIQQSARPLVFTAPDTTEKLEDTLGHRI